jgi:hypothetical protein
MEKGMPDAERAEIQVWCKQFEEKERFKPSTPSRSSKTLEEIIAKNVGWDVGKRTPLLLAADAR